MRHVLLIAVNFVREQRWPILVLMLWVVGFSVLGLVVNLHSAADDVLFIFKQLGVYGIAFAVFFGASAIHNERKTRRILAVLSKSVGRGEYLSGLIAGITLSTGIYCFAMGIAGSWILSGAGFPIDRLWWLMLNLLLACLLSSTAAVLFSTFMNPLFATLGTGLALGLPAALARRFGTEWGYPLPAYSLLEVLLKAAFGPQPPMPMKPVYIAMAEAGIFWILAWLIFNRRDIAVAVD